MDKRHKDIMSALVGKLRHILVGTHTNHGSEPGDLDRELERLGIDRAGEVTPIDVIGDIYNGDGQTYRVAATHLNRLPTNQRKAARREIVERAAYTWINRLLALRAMEVRSLIDDTLRMSEDYGGLSEKLYLLRLDAPASATEADGGWWTVLKNACAELARARPGLFALDDPDAALHPTAGALIQCIALVGGKTPVLPNVTPQELDATFADPDAIGWAYQFYQTEPKSEIDAKCKSGGKAVSRAELAAKTQLFTEPYMVQWLLQNSLGRSYAEANPHSTLPASWPYYIQPEPASTAPEQLFPLEELILIDPCMGSGHFLRAAFDMFVAMYREQHPEMSAVQVADKILGEHLFGIDLDPRAAQLSALTLYLRACEIVKAERRSGDITLYIPPEMHLATTPTNLDRGALQRHIQRYPDDIVYQPLLEKIFEGLEQADTLGSLLRSREYLDQAIADLQRPHTVELAYSQAEVNLRSDVNALAHSSPEQLRQMLLDRIAASFHSEATRTDDVSMALFGTTRDLLSLQVANIGLDILPSGRLAVNQEQYDRAMEGYFPVVTAREFSNAVKDFGQHWQRNVDTAHDAEMWTRIDAAATQEFGCSMTDLQTLLATAWIISEDLDPGVVCLPMEEFLDRLVAHLPWSREHIQRTLELLSLVPRQNFLKPSAPYKPADVYPWRFNRQLSYLRRPFVRREWNGSIEILWGNRHLYRSIFYLNELCFSGRLSAQARTPEMRQLMGEFLHQRGEVFNDHVADFLAQHAEKGVIVERRVKAIGELRKQKGPPGDIDVLVIDPNKKRVWVIECKDFAAAHMPHQIANELENLFLNKGGRESKVERRVMWVREHLDYILEWFKIESRGKWKAEPFIVVSQELFTPYLRRSPIRILSFDALKRGQG